MQEHMNEENLMDGDWKELISQPQFKVIVDKDVKIPMRDGVRLAVDIYRPDAPGKFPVLIAQSPYGKEIQQLPMPPQAQGGPVWDGGIEAGDSYYFVPRGYVHIVADVRGTGYSEGEYEFLYAMNQQQDGYDLVEWAAKQSWSSGEVGLMGMSYFGAIQPYVAIQQPPHLKAIFPIAGSADLYRDINYNGGMLGGFFYGLWDGRGGDSGFAMGNIVSAMKNSLSEEEYKRRLEETLANPDIQMNTNYYHLLKYPKKNPMYIDVLLNPLDGPFWEERSSIYKADKIEVPMYAIGAWKRSYWAGTAFALYNKASTPHKKVLIDPSGWWDRPWITYYEENIRWFDHWLKGVDTGIMDEPPIKIWVKGANEWRYENEWPLARTVPTKFYLRSFGRLLTEPENYMKEPDSFFQHALHVSYDINSLVYETPPLNQEVEVTGPVACYLYGAIDQDDTNWIVRLSDVDENGEEEMLARGYLKASHRAVDSEKSTPLQPYHVHREAVPVIPGQAYEYAIEVQPISNVFKAGHRIRLEIRSMEHGSEGAQGQPPNSSHLCSSRGTLHHIFRDMEHQSHLLLPVIPKQ